MCSILILVKVCKMIFTPKRRQTVNKYLEIVSFYIWLIFNLKDLTWLIWYFQCTYKIEVIVELENLKSASLMLPLHCVRHTQDDTVCTHLRFVIPSSHYSVFIYISTQSLPNTYCKLYYICEIFFMCEYHFSQL